ncbi:MAG TPA: transglutaminase-like domain-containing protein [Desulfomonilia bacterium]|nr:transglutaminase-like domain-containing protein [Desulfomonilia bacterium]
MDVFTAIDVLDRGKAECQGHAFLYAALARASGIPTKVVNGIVYSDDFGVFLYHTWVESCIGDSWVTVDPTFSQIRPDATHIVFA